MPLPQPLHAKARHQFVYVNAAIVAIVTPSHLAEITDKIHMQLQATVYNGILRPAIHCQNGKVKLLFAHFRAEAETESVHRVMCGKACRRNGPV